MTRQRQTGRKDGTQSHGPLAGSRATERQLTDSAVIRRGNGTSTTQGRCFVLKRDGGSGTRVLPSHRPLRARGGPERASLSSVRLPVTPSRSHQGMNTKHNTPTIPWERPAGRAATRGVLFLQRCDEVSGRSRSDDEIRKGRGDSSPLCTWEMLADVWGSVVHPTRGDSWGRPRDAASVNEAGRRGLGHLAPEGGVFVLAARWGPRSPVDSPLGLLVGMGSTVRGRPKGTTLVAGAG